MIIENADALLGMTAERSLAQLNTSKSEALPCFATENLWVGYAERFADPTSKNEVSALTTGAAYFKEFIKACDAAEKEIYITGWQVNWDALLDHGVRLFDVLLKAAKRGCHVYVLPWDDSAPIQTYDDETKAALLEINNILKASDGITDKRVHVMLQNSLADKDRAFFAHHQKCVVIDRKIAFVGGIDLAYGRFDDASYSLVADDKGREALNRYNGCVYQTGELKPKFVVNAADLNKAPDEDESGNIIKDYAPEARNKIQHGAWQVPLDPYRVYGTPIYATLDAKVQPRMPWQDVQLKITGPAVLDLVRNFTLRWNMQASSRDRLSVPTPDKYAGNGGQHVQVLRSAPASMRVSESKSLPRSAQKTEPNGAQNDIARAMAILIDKAQHFIYIENQFFVSEFGQTRGYQNNLTGPAQIINKKNGTGAFLTTALPGTADELPKNDICLLLAGRIGRAILDPANPNFHVYITLPVHPEGSLGDGAVVTQVHWTMQTLVFGSMSLLNRIRRFIKARELRDQKDPDWGRPLREDNHDFENVQMEACFKYVTLLNLRNWEMLGDRYVTEQIYVHSKMMIADDRFAIVGSANINDRSLLGSRDSELAVMVMDTEVSKVDLCGDGKQRPTRTFARNLRQEVWRKLFGITGGVRPATDLMDAIDKPADPKSWAAIQKVAKKNTKLYEAAFDWIPRNKTPFIPLDESEPGPASIWPRWYVDPVKNTGAKLGFMPFDKEFWASPQTKKPPVNLEKIKGYITLLPIEWTTGENNNIGYHTALVTENKQSPLPQQSIQYGQATTEKKQA